MKIGLVCPYNLWKGGGVQECVFALQEELAARGHEVKIITPQPVNHTAVIPDHVVIAGNSATFKAMRTNGVISAAIQVDAIDEMLKKEKFDVLHFHEPWVPLVSRQILVRSKSINVATFHAKHPDGVVTRAIERMAVPYAKSIQKYLHVLTAVSPAAAEFVKSIEPSAKVHIVPNGIDLQKYKPTANKKTTPKRTILYIGRLEKRKGVNYLLEAYAGLIKNNKDISLIIAGDGPLRAKYQTWVKENKVPNVKFLGYVSDKKKYDLLNTADLFCSPALYGESFGIVLLEAMAMGVVTVAGNNPGYSGVLKESGRISLLNPKDVDEFTRRLELLLNDGPIRKTWKSWAKEYIKQFDYKIVADQYEKLYLEALKKRK